MTIDYEAAIDTIFALFLTDWNANTTPIVGYIPDVQYQGVEEPETPPSDKYWVRLSQQTVLESQSTFRNGVNGKRYTTEGLVFVQIFCPRSDSESMEKGRKLAKVARNAYRGKSIPGSIWFRDSRINEIPPEEKFIRFNVISEYEYDEQS